MSIRPTNSNRAARGPRTPSVSRVAVIVVILVIVIAIVVSDVVFASGTGVEAVGVHVQVAGLSTSSKTCSNGMLERTWRMWFV